MFKKRGDKSQISIEFMFIVGFAFILVAGTSYYFLVFMNSTEENIAFSRSTKVGENIVDAVKDAVSSNGYYKKTIHLSVPDELNSIKVERNSLVMNVTTSNGDSDLAITSDIKFGTKIVMDEIQSGVFTIEKVDDVVVVCTGTSCSCDPSENTPALCSDGMDNDCNGYADREDCACAGFYGVTDSDSDGNFDDDLDGYIDIYCDGKLPDCDDTKPLVYPNIPSLCDYDYNVDLSCAGLKSDDPDCGVVDCSGYYNLIGIESPTDTQTCYGKKDMTSNRCDSLGVCKADNSADCDLEPDDAVIMQCGICKRVTPGDCDGTTGIVACENYAADTDTGLCRECDGSGSERADIDDAGCGTIDCDGLDNYYITGTQSETSTSYCNYANYADLVANRCEADMTCKDANTAADCGAPTTTIPNTAGICKYISGCTGTTPGSVSNYAADTDTGLCRECDGSGSERADIDDAGCGTIDCDGLDNYYITGTQGATTTSFCNYANYADLVANRCEADMTCKDINSADCGAPTTTTPNTAGICKYISGCTGTTPGSISNYAFGTVCGVNQICDGAGSCVAAYGWSVTGWTSCSRVWTGSRYEYVKNQVVSCIRLSDSVIVADANCVGPKPASSQAACAMTMNCNIRRFSGGDSFSASCIGNELALGGSWKKLSSPSAQGFIGDYFSGTNSFGARHESWPGLSGDIQCCEFFADGVSVNVNIDIRNTGSSSWSAGTNSVSCNGDEILLHGTTKRNHGTEWGCWPIYGGDYYSGNTWVGSNWGGCGTDVGAKCLSIYSPVYSFFDQCTIRQFVSAGSSVTGQCNADEIAVGASLQGYMGNSDGDSYMGDSIIDSRTWSATVNSVGPDLRIKCCK